jgi:hypothetical protein
MRKAILPISSFAIACAAIACGPSYTQTVKTPDEIVAEQEQIAASQEKHKSHYDTGAGGELDSEKRKKFDERQSEIEINRAVRSAETCPGVVSGGPYGEANVSITFNNEGHVIADRSTIDTQFHDKPIGDCVLRALNAIIVPSYVGTPVTKQLKIKLVAEAPKK